MTLSKCHNYIPILNSWIWGPRTHYFSRNSKIPRVDHFRLNWDYRKMPKWFISNIDGHKHDLKTHNEPSKPKLLLFGTMVYEKLDKGLLLAILGFCQVVC